MGLDITPGSSGKGSKDVFQRIGPDGKVKAEYKNIFFKDGKIKFDGKFERYVPIGSRIARDRKP